MEVISQIAIEDDKSFEFFILRKESDKTTIHFEDKDLKELFETIPKKLVKRINADKPERKKNAFIVAILQFLLKHKHNTFFLPASRTFYPTFYQYIYDIERSRREEDMKKLLDLLESSKSKNIGDVKLDLDNLNLLKRPYTKPLNEIFEKMYNFNTDVEVVKHYLPLVEKISNLMGGDVAMSSIEGVSMVDFLFQIRTIKKDLPLYMSSSSVNQLMLIYLYLKYWTHDKENFLMIDEPEENLNPKNQIKFLEILIDFANQNDNKVLVTTHSPLFTEALNSYLYLDVLKNTYKLNIDKILADNNVKYLSPSFTFAKENLGVYFFDGNQIIDYQDNNHGVFFREFKEVTDDIERSNQILTDYIYLKEEETHG